MQRRARFLVVVVAVALIFAYGLRVYQYDSKLSIVADPSGWPAEWLHRDGAERPSTGTGPKKIPVVANKKPIGTIKIDKTETTDAIEAAEQRLAAGDSYSDEYDHLTEEDEHKDVPDEELEYLKVLPGAPGSLEDETRASVAEKAVANEGKSAEEKQSARSTQGFSAADEFDGFDDAVPLRSADTKFPAKGPAESESDTESSKTLSGSSGKKLSQPSSKPVSLKVSAVSSSPEASKTTAASKLETSTKSAASTDDDDDVDWSRFAYAQYITDEAYLCNTIMLFEALNHLGSRPDRVMMYPAWMLKDPKKAEADTYSEYLLLKARDSYKAKMVPIEIERRDTAQDTWAESYTKLLAFNQTQYDRVLSLDSDSLILQPMDELFLMPPCPIAMPRAYWLLKENKHILSSQVMLIQPDAAEFKRVMERVNTASDDSYDMDIMNDLYYDSAMVLPHRQYDMLTAEFRMKDHAPYLGSDREKWDPNAALEEAKFVHFSDWPVPKPWKEGSDMSMTRPQSQPDCNLIDGEEDCTEREIWNGFYETFKQRRNALCSPKDWRSVPKDTSVNPKF